MEVAIAILAIGVLIIVHEAGHYFVARWCNMRVDRFSVGFGPPVFSKTYDGTDFTVGPIPFGGFVQIHGMLVSDDVDEADERAYPNRPTWQRFLTIFAGPATNYLFAVVLAVGLYMTAGVPDHQLDLVGEVASGFDAHGKLLAGDQIVAINGQDLSGSVQAAVVENKEKPMLVTVLRGGERKDFTVTPTVIPDAKEKEPRYRLGIVLAVRYNYQDVSTGTALGSALAYPVEQTQKILGQLYSMIRREVDGELLGPVGIATVVKRSLDLGWRQFLGLLMLLNVYLGLFNLLPLPALDGGRLAFLGYELATRRRPNPKIEATVHMVGIMALFVVLILVTYKDIAKLF